MAHGFLADGCQGADGRLAPLNPGRGQLDVLVVVRDGLLDQLGAHVGALGAGCAVDPTAAKEVGVLGAGFAGGDAEGQATPAASAIHAATQVVLTDAGALPGDPLFVKQRLHALEGLGVNQRLVPPVESLFVVGAFAVDELADVVGVTQQALDNGGAELLGGALGGRTGAQPQALQLGGKLRNGVFTAGIELESQRDERATFRVDGCHRDMAAVGQYFDAVDVAQASRAVGAARLGLSVEAALDAPAGLHRLVLVVEGEHALHVEGLRRVVTDHRLGD
ncbi:MAG TPA: hypothetical protein VHW67_05760 [Solirubrobacteraceae bacterium]|nr:hypothetical protein [Solirubrobacteraceae bacterium]